MLRCGKKIKGRKRHIFTDIEGNLVHAVIHTANVQDRDGAPLVLAEIIKRSGHPNAFEVLPRRCVIERTFAWIGRNRRLAKDLEQTIASATAWLFLASIQLFTRGIARA